jgi:hypothetical protein
LYFFGDTPSEKVQERLIDDSLPDHSGREGQGGLSVLQGIPSDSLDDHLERLRGHGIRKKAGSNDED